ncbi:MAG TPA: addiction module protein [Longimicrobium sp.]|nr:addiction module protein [Longimicrobium sp.]
MAMRFEEVESAALQLPRTERARIAERLIASLDEDAEIEQAWLDEVERRVREVDAGEVQLIPGDQVMDEIRALLR